MSSAAVVASTASLRASSHAWTFFRTGGIDQVALGGGDDLRHLEGLDQKLWVALSCPVKGLEIDEQTLALIDSDEDGRIRAPELIAAVNWACARLKNPGDLLAGADRLALDAMILRRRRGRFSNRVRGRFCAVWASLATLPLPRRTRQTRPRFFRRACSMVRASSRPPLRRIPLCRL